MDDLNGTAVEAQYDIVVVGGGGAGLPTALFARWLGNTVCILEKAPDLGGTARKAAFWYWVPNNAAMRSLGIADEKLDCLRYMARLSRPECYDGSSPTLGLPDWEYRLLETIYESASPPAELLNERGALTYRHCPDVPDYWAEVPENKAPRGRVLLPARRARRRRERQGHQRLIRGGKLCRVAIRSRLLGRRGDARADYRSCVPCRPSSARGAGT